MVPSIDRVGPDVNADAVARILDEAWQKAEGLALASGGGRDGVLHVQVLRITPALAIWHELQGRRYVALIPSLLPVGHLPVH